MLFFPANLALVKTPHSAKIATGFLLPSFLQLASQIVGNNEAYVAKIELETQIEQSDHQFLTENRYGLGKMVIFSCIYGLIAKLLHDPTFLHCKG